MKDFIQKGLEKIKQEKIKPTPKWKFEVQNFFWWVVFAFSILAGGISISILVFLVKELDWNIYGNLGESFLKTFLVMFPHLWLFFLLVFIFISYRNLRHTKKGYHYELFIAVGVILVASFILGLFLYFFKVNEKLNKVFIRNIPGYSKVIHTKENQWSQPAKGLLAGKIIREENANNDRVLVIETFKAGNWEVFVIKNTFVKRNVKLKRGEIIKIIGRQKQRENQFEAIEIRPWEGRGQNSIKNTQLNK